MRILHTESSPNFGGQELRAIEEMEWFQQCGHQVWLAAAENSGIQKAAAQRGLPVIPIRFRGSINPAAAAKLFAACRRFRIDLLVTRGSRDTSCAWPVARLLGIPLVRYQHICKQLKEGVFQEILWRRAPDQIVVVSGSIKQRLLTQKLADESAIEVIGEYVDRRVFHPGVSAGDCRARHGIPADAFLITNIGMLRSDKGQHLLVAAADEILRRHPQCWFLFIGGELTPGYLASLQAGIQRTTRPERFVFAGFQRDTAPYLAASDLVCLSSLIEAQSKVIPQAFAMNKLVVAPNVGGIPELLHDRENGLLYEREKPNALAEAVDAAFACDREKLLANARAAAERLDINVVMAQTEKLYTSLVT